MINDLDAMLKKITEHFGIETELMKLSEEIGELQKECYSQYYKKDTDNVKNIEDEMADVLVVLLQIMLYFNADSDKIGDIMDSKAKRTVKRIEEGWYDKHR